MNPVDPDGERMHAAMDADWLRLAAIDALQRGRLELGAGLTRMALAAAKAAGMALPAAAREPVPMPVAPEDREQLLADLRGYEVPDPAATSVDLTGPDADETYAGQTTVVPSSRCVATMLGNGAAPGETCWGALYYERRAGVWRHVHPIMDADHTPQAQAVDEAAL